MRRLVALVAVLVLIRSAEPAAAQTANHLAVARDVVGLLQIGPTMQAGMTTMVDVQISQTPLLAPYREVMLTWAQRYLTAEAAAPEFARIYAATFTEAELRELATFFRTPTGQKLVAAQPALVREGSAVGERLGQKHQTELKQMIEARAAELQRGSSSAATAP